MNYLKKYIKLIRRAQGRPVISGYGERHHIFGNNKRLVKLTAREHYLAHALLEKLYIKRYGIRDPRSHKMIKAFFMMNNAKGKGQHRYINSRLYEANKLRFSASVSGANHHFYGKSRVFSEEHLAKLRATYKRGPDNPSYGKPRSAAVKAKISAAKQDISPETRERISKARQGMIFSDEHKANLRSSRVGKKSSAETKARLSLAQRGKIKKSRGRTKYVLEITNPNGETETVTNIRDYCEQHGMPRAMDSFKWIARGKTNTDMYKGYKVLLISRTGGDR